MATANRFENCCFDYTLIGTRSECDRLLCEGQHKPVFNLHYHKINKETCYSLNRDQLGQFWQCVVNDRNTFCPERYKKCHVCNIMHEVFVELQDAYFFLQRRRKQIVMSLFLINLCYGVCLQMLSIKIEKKLYCNRKISS